MLTRFHRSENETYRAMECMLTYIDNKMSNKNDKQLLRSKFRRRRSGSGAGAPRWCCAVRSALGAFRSFLQKFKPLPAGGFLAVKCARDHFRPYRVHLSHPEALLYRILGCTFFKKFYAEGP